MNVKIKTFISYILPKIKCQAFKMVGKAGIGFLKLH